MHDMDERISAEVIGKLILEELKCIREDMKKEVRSLGEKFQLYLDINCPKENEERRKFPFTQEQDTNAIKDHTFSEEKNSPSEIETQKMQELRKTSLKFHQKSASQPFSDDDRPKKLFKEDVNLRGRGFFKKVTQEFVEELEEDYSSSDEVLFPSVKHVAPNFNLKNTVANGNVNMHKIRSSNISAILQRLNNARNEFVAISDTEMDNYTENTKQNDPNSTNAMLNTDLLKEKRVCNESDFLKMEVFSSEDHAELSSNESTSVNEAKDNRTDGVSDACRQCLDGFEKTEDMVEHMKTHSKSSSNVSVSPKREISVQKSTLDKHVKKLLERKIYQCRICKKEFSMQIKLDNHMKFHSTVIPLAQEEQSQTINSPINQTSTKLAFDRDGKKLYQCKICNKSFIYTSQSYRRHMMIHTGERPYRCQFCKKGFIRSANLKMHERTHTGEKPFQCKYCKKSFRVSWYLKKHINSVHFLDE